MTISFTTLRGKGIGRNWEKWQLSRPNPWGPQRTKGLHGMSTQKRKVAWPRGIHRLFGSQSFKDYLVYCVPFSPKLSRHPAFNCSYAQKAPAPWVLGYIIGGAPEGLWDNLKFYKGKRFFLPLPTLRKSSWMIGQPSALWLPLSVWFWENSSPIPWHFGQTDIWDRKPSTL